MQPTYVSETQPEGDYTFVIQNIGGITLTNGKKCHYVVGMKNCLKNEEYINTPGKSLGPWEDSGLRKWCNEEFRNAIPEAIRGCFKQFKCITATNRRDNTITTTDDYFTLPAAKEIFKYPIYSIYVENNALRQFEWYKITNNVYKLLGDYGSLTYYNTRSIKAYDYESDYYYCCITDKGGTSIGNGYAISPFGCI